MVASAASTLGALLASASHDEEGVEDSLDALVRALAHSYDGVRVAAAMALGTAKRQHQSASQALLKVLQVTHVLSADIPISRAMPFNV